MVVLDNMMVSVALPQIGGDLAVDNGLEWVVTANFLAMGVAQPLTGWLANRFGEKEAFCAALGGFAMSSALSAAAPSFGVLVGGRALQGLFAGLVVPLAASLMFAIFPPEQRGTAVGLSGGVVMVAPGLGPLLSGSILSLGTWRWIMLVSVGFGLVAFIGGLWVIPRAGRRADRRLDGGGLALLGSGLVGLLVALSFADEWGWLSARFIAVLVLSLLLLAAYSRHARRVEDPLLDPRILADPVFRSTIIIVWLISMAQFGRIVFIPIELQAVRDHTALEAGLVLALAALASAGAMPLSGRWTDRAGGRPPILAGLGLLALALTRLGTLRVETPEWQVMASVAAMALGVSLVLMPATVVALNEIARRFGQELVSEAAAVRSLNRQIAGAVMTVALASVVVASTGTLNVEPADQQELALAQQAFNRVYLAALAGVAIVFVLVWRLPGRPESELAEVPLQPE